MVHCRDHKISPMIPLLRQVTLVHIITAYSLRLALRRGIQEEHTTVSM